MRSAVSRRIDAPAVLGDSSGMDPKTQIMQSGRYSEAAEDIRCYVRSTLARIGVPPGPDQQIAVMQMIIAGLENGKGKPAPEINAFKDQ